MTIETAYTIKIERNEADTIQKCIHKAYMGIKESGEDYATQKTRGLEELRRLRDSFSAITNRTYMGIDA